MEVERDDAVTAAWRAYEAIQDADDLDTQQALWRLFGKFYRGRTTAGGRLQLPAGDRASCK